MTSPDPRADLELTLRVRDRDLRLASTWGLFSPREIDAGTRLLLDCLELAEADRCLDLGCGYGPIGLAMAVMAPRGEVLMVDRDFIAVEYAARNAEANGLLNASAMLSNGLAQVGDREFDVIASNLPAKVGRDLYQIFVEDAHAHLAPGGAFYAVMIRQLWPALKREAERVFGNAEKVRLGAKHVVLRARGRLTPTQSSPAASC